MTKLQDQSLEQLHALLVSKEITAQDLTQATFERIKETEDTMGSFITLNEEKALEMAKALDEKGISEGNVLAGLPIGIKDNIVTKDLRTTAASKILYNFDPIYDATVMEKVYQADMIPVGKLNMDEFAMGGSTETSHFKKTTNAWDHTKVPGGFFRERYRWQYPPTSRIQRYCGLETNIWSRVSFWFDCLCVISRPNWTIDS